MSQRKPGEVPMAGGKTYKMVVARVDEFRTSPAYANWGIDTELVYHEPGVMAVVKATITDGDGRQRGSGLAWDAKNHSSKHAKSFVELAETSAIGRALASIGLAGSSEYASAEELHYALQPEVQEAQPKPPPPPLEVVKPRETDADRKAMLNEQWTKLAALQKEVKKQTWLKHWKKFEALLTEAELANMQPFYQEWMKRYAESE